MVRSNNLSKKIIIETIIIMIFIFFMIADYFSSHHILDLFIHWEQTEHLLIEEKSPDTLSRVRIYQIDPSSLSSLDIRVDFLPDNESKTYSYYTYVSAEDMPVDNQYYDIEWKNNIPYIYLSGGPTITIVHTDQN